VINIKAIIKFVENKNGFVAFIVDKADYRFEVYSYTL